MIQKVRVGVVGCGAISGAYLKNAQRLPILEIAACADINPASAQSKAAEFAIPEIQTVDEMMADKSIDIILNLTVPKAHAAICHAALDSRKHVYTEKPLAINRSDAAAILAKARQNNLLAGGAPDTFLGAGLQTARKAIDDGSIGRPVAFTAFMMCPGHESWHPSPEFYYEQGGGPMLDMGPYYVTALLNLLGPVKRITGLGSIAIPDRTITSQPKAGKKMTVETIDHVSGSMEFQQGAIGSITMSFATRFPQYDGQSPIVIYGTEGTLLVPDPNRFTGPVKLRRNEDPEFRELSLLNNLGYERSIGLADMAYAIRNHRAPRASGGQCLAALDVMLGFEDSSSTGRAYSPTAPYTRPEPLAGELDS
ncbi:MAG: Gfo/Idh/MocA family oxidoreductase [Planctomycetota bacterium]|nr:Gfo/Idh/MocA family oxidoreductase [Planctomycetota bacterium]